MLLLSSIQIMLFPFVSIFLDIDTTDLGLQLCITMDIWLGG